MIPFYLSLAALSFSFAGAVPLHTSVREALHLPLLFNGGTISVEEYIIAASDLRDKYGYPQSSPSKRQDIPVTEEVCPCSVP